MIITHPVLFVLLYDAVGALLAQREALTGLGQPVGARQAKHSRNVANGLRPGCIEVGLALAEVQGPVDAAFQATQARVIGLEIE